MKRGISVTELTKKKFKQMGFAGKWKAAIGDPGLTGVWIVWGNSGNGKTRFALQLAKYIAQFAKVAYNSLEEGISKSFQKAVIETQIADVSGSFILLDRESLDDLKLRLAKRRSPSVIFIDSFQYTGLNKQQYIQLKSEFPNKLFIFISHAEGKHPEGRPAKFVRYDADVKIRIEGYKAFCTSRFGGGEPYTIWEQGANDYWIDK